MSLKPRAVKTTIGAQIINITIFFISRKIKSAKKMDDRHFALRKKLFLTSSYANNKRVSIFFLHHNFTFCESFLLSSQDGWMKAGGMSEQEKGQLGVVVVFLF